MNDIYIVIGSIVGILACTVAVALIWVLAKDDKEEINVLKSELAYHHRMILLIYGYFGLSVEPLKWDWKVVKLRKKK